MNSEENQATTTLYVQLGGEARVKALVETFYDLMDLEPRYAALRAAHGSTLENARERLFWYLCGWLGGPQYYTDRFGHPKLRARHLPFSIGDTERDQWILCMHQAMTEIGVEAGLQQQLIEALYGVADWMRNKE
ncbi:MAG: group II truncated hemoglobin [Pseudomonadota bacterium]